jgi:large subunit ribosomal protein L18Ae
MYNAQLHQYTIIGRRSPSEKDPNPKLYKMVIFAPNTVVAKSRYWYFVNKLKKIKKANGEIVNVTEVPVS